MDGYITIGTKLDTKSFDQQILEVERKVNELEKELSANKELGFLSPEELHQANLELEKAKNKLVGLYQQKTKLQGGKKDTTFSDMGSALATATKQAGRLALGIFGVRSAYMLLKRASSELASYDEQYATDLQYIAFALTQMVAPALKYIVSLAGQLLGYINAIANAWFGINIFGNASVEDFNKMKKGAGGVSKAVKEIKKQLAGFDEMNVLTEDKDTGGGGGGGAIAPSFDLSDLEAQTTEWLNGIVDWIKDNSGLIIGLVGLIIAGIGAQIGALPLVVTGILIIIWGLIVQFWDDIKAGIQSGIDWLFGQSDNLRPYIGDLGVFIYETFIETFQFILNYVDIIINQVKDVFNDFIEFFKAVFTGDWETAWNKILDIATNPIEFMQNLFINTMEFITKIFGHFVDFFSNQSGWIREVFGDVIGDLYDRFVSNLQIIKNIFETYINTMKIVFENIIGFIKNVFTGNWKGAWENICNIVTAVFNNLWTIITGILGMIWGNITTWASSIGGAIGNAVSGAFKFVVNGILSMIENTLNGPIRTINSLGDAIRGATAGLISLPRIRTFSIPRLKSGGIINMPNTGVIVGSAIAGESGKEGVLPLTDSQTMAELGKEIGRWITINANITNTMNGRVISRELRTIQNEQDFAYNT